MSTTEPAQRIVKIDEVTEWKLTLLQSPGVEHTATFDTLQHALEALDNQPAHAYLTRVETTYYLRPHEAADYFAAMTQEASK